MRYAIARKDTVLVPINANTKKSRYPVNTFTAFRKFKRREDARSYKQSLKNPGEYSIIDTTSLAVIR